MNSRIRTDLAIESGALFGRSPGSGTIPGVRTEDRRRGGFDLRSVEILDARGVTIQNVFGSKTYLWKDLVRFEILWDYESKRMGKREEVDAPYILLKFENPKKKIRFDYLEAIDQHIRACYGQPHVDNWTNIGK